MSHDELAPCDHSSFVDVVVDGNWWVCSGCGDVLEAFTPLPSRPVRWVRERFDE